MPACISPIPLYVVLLEAAVPRYWLITHIPLYPCKPLHWRCLPPTGRSAQILVDYEIPLYAYMPTCYHTYTGAAFLLEAAVPKYWLIAKFFSSSSLSPCTAGVVASAAAASLSACCFCALNCSAVNMPVPHTTV